VVEDDSSRKVAKDPEELIKTIEGTPTPLGEEEFHDEMVGEFIAVIGAVAGVDNSPLHLSASTKPLTARRVTPNTSLRRKNKFSQRLSLFGNGNGNGNGVGVGSLPTESKRSLRGFGMLLFFPTRLESRPPVIESFRDALFEAIL